MKSLRELKDTLTQHKLELAEKYSVKGIGTLGSYARGEQLPEQIRQRYPAVPWSSMVRMRDRPAHGYWSVDNEIVWKVVQEELPVIKPQLVAVHERERGSGEHG